MRQMTSAHVHTPANVITPPSPPGTWKAPLSARMNSSASTPTATRSTAASTNENAPHPVSDAEAERRLLTPLAITVS